MKRRLAVPVDALTDEDRRGDREALRLLVRYDARLGKNGRLQIPGPENDPLQEIPLHGETTLRYHTYIDGEWELDEGGPTCKDFFCPNIKGYCRECVPPGMKPGPRFHASMLRKKWPGLVMLSPEGRLLRKGPRGWEPIEPPEKYSTSLEYVIRDPDGHLWAMIPVGLFKLEEKDGLRIVEHHLMDLPAIGPMLLDSEGALWIRAGIAVFRFAPDK